MLLVSQRALRISEVKRRKRRAPALTLTGRLSVLLVFGSAAA